LEVAQRIVSVLNNIMFDYTGTFQLEGDGGMVGEFYKSKELGAQIDIEYMNIGHLPSTSIGKGPCGSQF